MALTTRYRARRALEWAGLPLLYAGLGVIRLYRPSFHETSPHLYRAADRLGVFPLVDHYHDPPVRLAARARRTRRTLPGIDLRIDEQLELLSRFRYGDELLAIPMLAESDVGPYFGNPSFAAPDSQIYYSMLRHFRPRRVLEVGSGQSTRFAAQALELNRVEGSPGELVAIEPYEAPELETLGVHVVRSRVEDLNADPFAELQEGDVLFIDSSHVVRPGGDVTLLMLDVIPAMPPGILVHVHDVFTPRDPPDEWVRRRWFWAEQYVVEALLTYNPRLEVLLAVDLLLSDYPTAIAAACPVPSPPGPGPTPASFWLRTCAEPPTHSEVS
jgi:hypothetical protein